MNYYPKLLEQLKNCANDTRTDALTNFQFKYLAKTLESVNTKRLIFDARQARVFDSSAEIDERRRDKIHPPFSSFYLELTEPVLLSAQEPGCKDVLRAILYTRDVIEGVECINGGTARREVLVTKVTFFYKDQEDESFVDRSFSLSPEGYPLVGRAHSFVRDRYKPRTNDKGQLIGGVVTHTPNAKGTLDSSELANPLFIPEYVKEGEMVSVFELPKLGWWEECVISYTNLLYWIFAYTMAKSVEIVVIPWSRQVQRAHMRKEGRIPEPWHVVKVQPRIIKQKPETVGGESGIKHSYRYDVIGHLRFNRHKTKSGDYTDSIEWVADHQRGLENAMYIPKTYQIDKDKKIAMKEMKQYFEQ